MKARFLALSFCASLFLMMAGQLHAQVDDTLPPWFKAPMELLGKEPLFKKDIAFIMTPSTIKKVSSVPASTAKKLRLPRNVKRVPTPLNLKHKGACYQIGCVKGKECDTCGMFWLDKNKDGKVQPRKEIRCICKEGKPCKVRGRKVECKR